MTQLLLQLSLSLSLSLPLLLPLLLSLLSKFLLPSLPLLSLLSLPLFSLLTFSTLTFASFKGLVLTVSSLVQMGVPEAQKSWPSVDSGVVPIAAAIISAVVCPKPIALLVTKSMLS